MTTRAELRQDLRDKLVGLEDSGYGDFDWSDDWLGSYLALAVARLFPDIYKREVVSSQTPIPYGSAGYGYVLVDNPERVTYVEDAAELDYIYGWSTRVDKVIAIPAGTTVNIGQYAPFVLPTSDTDTFDLPSIYDPLVVLGALIETLESRHDTGVRPDDSGQYIQTPLIDRLNQRYTAMRAAMALTLPMIVS